MYIYRVSPTGIMKKVGTTKGKGDAENIVNVGLECLNFRVGRRIELYLLYNYQYHFRVIQNIFLKM